MHIEDIQNHGLTPDRYKMHTDTQEGEFISEEQEICMEDTQGTHMSKDREQKMHTQNIVTGDNKCIKQVTRKCTWNTHRNQKEKK